MTSKHKQLLQINCPEVFADPAFIEWLNGDGRPATWHERGRVPAEYSDLFVTYENKSQLDEAEGSDSDMPEPLWRAITAHCDALGFTEGVLWLTNLKE